jgi:hypothetical protein
MISTILTYVLAVVIAQVVIFVIASACGEL